MKKIAAVLIIVTSIFALISNVIDIPDRLEYYEGIEYLNLIVYPIMNIGFILLGISIINESK